MSGVKPGDVIAGKFKVERVLGEGGMGYVVAATHLQLGQTVALKFMRTEVCTPSYKSRFLREARHTVKLKSKHVSRVLDVGTQDNGAPYMVMEYLEGTDLSNLLHSRGPVPVQEACDYIIQACEALVEAHSHGIVHRDLKPANLFLTRGPAGDPVVKVLDFGVSKVLELGMDEDSTSPGGRPRRSHDPNTAVTKATDLLGSPSYMAPEQIASASDADARSDIWSLGVILFRLVSGKAPFHAESLGALIQLIMNGKIPNLRDAMPHAPPGLENVVARCLERDRQKRLGDAAELARLLAPFAGPVATPSLERIAILGSSLVTAPRQVSRASFHSNPPPAHPPAVGSGPRSGPPAPQRSVPPPSHVHPSHPPPSHPPVSHPASRPHPHAPVSQRKPEMKVTVAIVWAVIFVVAVLFGLLAVGAFLKSRRGTVPTPSAPVSVTSVAVSAETPSAPPSAAPSAPPSAAPSAPPSAAPSASPTSPSTAPAPRAKPRASAPKAEIPPTRE